jgi:hypothetical protein
MSGELGTTNLFLGILAAVSVLEALLLIAVGVGGFVTYRKVSRLVDAIATRQVVPAVARVNAILDDVKTVTATVKAETERVDQAIHTTIDRIDDTTDRMRSNVRTRVSGLIGFVKGVRGALEQMRHARHRANDASPGRTI